MAGERYLFGPVPSRRLGRSLGVDVIPQKTCSYNCVYCQLGPTHKATLERKAYVPMEEVLAELAAWKAAGGEADAITLAGSGEPTLHLEFGRVLTYARDVLHTRSALLTNGTLLHLDDVRRQAALADIVKITLSAWDDASLATLHRPHPDVHFSTLFEGAFRFREVFKGQLWGEVFLVEDINTHPSALERLARLAEQLQPDRIHVNTAVRPAAEGRVRPVGRDVLLRACEILGQTAEITASGAVPQEGAGEVSVESVRALIERHPCSEDDLVTAFRADRKAVRRCLDELLGLGIVRQMERDGFSHYALTSLAVG